MNDKQIYFLSDFHLGAPDFNSSRSRERKIVSFLSEIQHKASEIFILGDMFDFWFEYSKVVPKGYTRLLGKLAELSDSGIKLHFFVGNHDMWMGDYFEKELNMKVYHEPHEFIFNAKKFLIGHGDGIGPGDHGYKRLKKLFRNPVAKWLFGVLPPRMGIGIAEYFSRRSRIMTGNSEEKFLGEENEWLIQFCREQLKTKETDFFIFGHRHLPIDFSLSEKSRYINTGDWIRYNSYAIFDGLKTEIRYY